MADDLDEPVREGPAGRNAPCPCGSGLRYRECCSGKKTIH
ncbi:MAG TPA: hypothetical protein ENJ37_01945 [Deltaproteobacteria bacterium]|nr:hypothetical protein [Deltaproteobacteria bacterium]